MSYNSTVKFNFSFIICTYNRNEILQHNIESFLPILKKSPGVQLLIVDNYISSTTEHIVNDFISKYDFDIVYVTEKSKGLSYARNAGILKSKYEWIIFVDDDSKIQCNYLQILEEILCVHKSLKCIGGRYLPWYLYGKPKWYRDEWASSNGKPFMFNELMDNQYFDGGNFVIHKSVFKEIGEFDLQLGMKGTSVSYGEEIELQLRMRNSKIPIYYSPDLLIYHLVPKYKMSVIWFLKSWYCHGKDYWVTYNVTPTGYKFGIKKFFKILLSAQFSLIGNLKNLKNQDYFIQNLLIDSLRIPMWELGKLISAKK